MTRSLWARRLHSLSGVAPLGGFLFLHFFELAQARRGPAHFDAISRALNAQWWLPLAEAVLIAGLLYHAGYGLFIALRARYRGIPHPWGTRGLAFVMQRWTGVILLAFLAYHLWHFRLQKIFGTLSKAPTLAEISPGLQGWPLLLFYSLFIIAAAWHLGNGLGTFLITWGITIRPAGQQRAAWIGQGLGLLAGALGFLAFFSLR